MKKFYGSQPMKAGLQRSVSLQTQSTTGGSQSHASNRDAVWGDLIDSAPEVPAPFAKSVSKLRNLKEETEMDEPPQAVQRNSRIRNASKSLRRQSRIYDDPEVVAGYASVPLIELDKLPRGGISFETKAAGRIQFGIPPETIKDSMILGIGVPSVYIVPVERFCLGLGPALGINLAEAEFPAYFNYFVKQSRCTLVVDSPEAEESIRKVFEETLLGPEQFRDHDNPVSSEDEDFDPSFPKNSRPDFYKEFLYFRVPADSENGEELTVDTLLDFCHFVGSKDGRTGPKALDRLGVPPTSEGILGDGRVALLQGINRSSSQKPMVEASVNPVADRVNDDDVPITASLRRVMSNPDLSKLSLEATVKSPESHATATQPPDVALDNPKAARRPSGLDGESNASIGYRTSEGMSTGSGPSFMFSSDDVDDPSRKSWMYSQVKWLGDVATVFPSTATDEQRRSGRTARVEIFKMAGGTEYIVHDVDENNIIVGKVRFSGTVRVPDEMAVEGFLAKREKREEVQNPPLGTPKDLLDGIDVGDDEDETNEAPAVGNIDIRIPQHVTLPTFHPPSFGVTVLGNSHGFDKKGSTSGYVLWINGRGVMIDPPPYSSATLEIEGIRPQMIMAIIVTHCHADHDAGTFQKVMTDSRVAIITTPTIYKSFIRKYAALSGLSPALLRHSHRRRPAIIGQPLKFQGATFHFTYTLHTIPCIGFRVEWRGRSMVFTGDHLNSPEVIDTLQTKGVLSKERADDLRRLPLQECDALLHEAGAPPIHTPLSVLEALPEHVRKRLYVVHTSALPATSRLRVAPTGTSGTIRLDGLDERKLRTDGDASSKPRRLSSALCDIDPRTFDDGGYPSISMSGDYLGPVLPVSEETNAPSAGQRRPPPLVFLRPTCVSDAWFILNLLSAVPFLSSLSYANTMEVLEIAQVQVFCSDEVVIPAHRRSEVLCVVWEGTCTEREVTIEMTAESDQTRRLNVWDHAKSPTVWHAGDWTGPVALQPDIERSAEVLDGERPRDVVAVSQEGVKVITLQMRDLYKILNGGSKLFRKYLELEQRESDNELAVRAQMANSDRNTQSIQGERDQSQMNWHSHYRVLEVLRYNSALATLFPLQKRHLESLAEGPRVFAPGQYLWQVGSPVNYSFLIVSGTASFSSKPVEARKNLQIRTESISLMGSENFGGSNSAIVEDKQLLNVSPNSEYARLETMLQWRAEDVEFDDRHDHSKDPLLKEDRMTNARDRFANTVLKRLYSRGAYTTGLVFSRGHLLSDTSRMISGNLCHIHQTGRRERRSSSCDGLPFSDLHRHTSNMVAGAGGCVVMVFPRSSLVQFLDNNPGVLLSLLGTQVVV